MHQSVRADASMSPRRHEWSRRWCAKLDSTGADELIRPPHRARASDERRRTASTPTMQTRRLFCATQADGARRDRLDEPRRGGASRRRRAGWCTRAGPRRQRAAGARGRFRAVTSGWCAARSGPRRQRAARRRRACRCHLRPSHGEMSPSSRQSSARSFDQGLTGLARRASDESASSGSPVARG